MKPASRRAPPRPAGRCALLALLLGSAAAGACMFRPVRVELRTDSRVEAIRFAKSALQLRYGRVILDEAPMGRLSTDDRYESNTPITVRTRAYVALVPGELGWAAEITVVKETLDSGTGLFLAPTARWAYSGRDASMERFLAKTLGDDWLRNPPPVFVESAPSSAASAPASAPSSRAR